MNEDNRMLFIVNAVHCVVANGEALEPDELYGLKQILESIIIDWRKRHEING